MSRGAKLTIGLFTFLAVLAGGIKFLSDEEGKGMFAQLINIIFPTTITPADLHSRYAARKLRVLIVPGHDNEFHGTEFRGLREADLNIQVAGRLAEFLIDDGYFEVFVSRDTGSGEYVQEFADYFSREWDSIKAFRDNSQTLMKTLLATGIAEEGNDPPHGYATDEISARLYGINKWANEHSIDVALHIHFNDHPRRNTRVPGQYSGFTIYVPESQYPNAVASQDLAWSLFGQLAQFLPVSDQPFEREGVVEDQGLIAVGSNASREGASLLVEYGYIYEPQFMNPAVRKPMMNELAFQTYQGIKKYFVPAATGQTAFDTSLLPHQWEDPLQKGERGNRDVLALQAALREEGVYPPPGKDFSSCPINGNFGSCVESAVMLFQSQRFREGLYGRGTVGRATIGKLNELYGP